MFEIIYFVFSVYEKLILLPYFHQTLRYEINYLEKCMIKPLQLIKNVKSHALQERK